MALSILAISFLDHFSTNEVIAASLFFRHFHQQGLTFAGLCQLGPGFRQRLRSSSDTLSQLLPGGFSLRAD
jgi:hypothetical protein